MRLILRRGLAALLLTAPMNGCRLDITEHNPSGTTAETVFTTPAGFETLVNAAYSYTRWWYGKEEGYNIAEMGTADYDITHYQPVLYRAESLDEVRDVVGGFVRDCTDESIAEMRARAAVAG